MLYFLITTVAAVTAFHAPLAVPGSRFAAVASPAAPRIAAAPAMNSIRELRSRVKSVKNTKKITSAMRLVAAAKVRRAQEACLRSRPFSECLERILGNLMARLAMESLDIPLLVKREPKTVALLVVTGDRGLCGGYNSNIIKKTENRIKELTAQGIKARRRPRAARERSSCAAAAPLCTLPSRACRGGRLHAGPCYG